MSSDLPERVKRLDLETADSVVRTHLRENYVNHPTRGPYVKSVRLYEEIGDDIDDGFDQGTFGIFCSYREYLKQWGDSGRGHQYRILVEKLGASEPATESQL